MDVGQNLSELLDARLLGLRITAAEFDDKAGEIAYRDPERFSGISMQHLKNCCRSDALFGDLLPLTEQDYNTLIFVLWDRNTLLFESETGIDIGAYDRVQRKGNLVLLYTEPYFDNPDEYAEWKYEQQLKEREEEQRRLWRDEMDHLQDDDF